MKIKSIISILFIVIYVAISSSVAYAQAPNAIYKTIKPVAGTRLNGTSSGNLKIPALRAISPAIRINTAIRSVNMVADKLSTLSARLTIRVTEAKSKGNDTTNLETLLTSMNSHIEKAKTTASTITPLPETATRENLQATKATIHTAILELKTAGADARQIIAGLIKLNVGSNVSGNSSSASSMIKPGIVNQITP